jgi:hypothetical protein
MTTASPVRVTLVPQPRQALTRAARNTRAMSPAHCTDPVVKGSRRGTA